ncbi:transcriptional regulator family: Fungal Specific TF [Aspergillus niger]|nr:transcriptional regulator family: Fungal Specific TF [Aspergillus niger]
MQLNETSDPVSDTSVRVMPEPSQKRKRAKTGTFLATDLSMTQAATDPPVYVAPRLLDLSCPQSQVRRDAAAVQSLPQPRGGVPLARTRNEAFLSHLNAAFLQHSGPSIDRHGRAPIVCMLPLSLCPLEMLQRSTDGSHALTSSAQSWMRRLQTAEMGNSAELSRPEILTSLTSSPEPESAPTHPEITDDQRPEMPAGDASPPETSDRLDDVVSALCESQSSPTQAAAGAVVTLSPRRSFLPSQDSIERLAVAFFRHVHVYRANAFLHRDQTLMAIRDGTFCVPVVLALCAVGARFTSPPQPDDVVISWATEAANWVTTATEVSRDHVVVALLLAIYMQQAGRFAQSHLWSAIANTHAVSLGLHRESAPGTSSFVESERDRRLFFACYAISRFISNGAPESIQCPASRIKLRLPCDGFNYRLDVSIETPYATLEADEPEPPGPNGMQRNVGAMGFWVRLVSVRMKIKRYFHSMTEDREERHAHQQPSAIGTTLAPWGASSPFVVCLAQLASLSESLPPRLQLSPELVLRQHDAPVLGQIVMFYLWWNECHLELYSIALHGYPQSLDSTVMSTAPAGWIDQARHNCLRHAQAITDILDLVDREMPRQPLTISDHTIAHVVYLSVRVQLELLMPTLKDSGMRLELKKRFDIMLGFVERTSKYFHQVSLVLHEMRRMLAGHELASGTFEGEDALSQTASLPWFCRQKALDSRRAAEQAGISAAHFEANLAELLPDCIPLGTMSWIRGYDVNDPCRLPETAESSWDILPNLWMGAPPTGQSTNNPVTAMSDFSSLGIFNTWGRIDPNGTGSRFDPLLPMITAPGNCDSLGIHPHPSPTDYDVTVVLGPVASTYDKSSSDENHADGDNHMQGRHSVTKGTGKELQTQTNLLPMKQLLVVFSGLSVAMLCSMLNQTIVATALPTLGAVFNQADIVSWVGTAYLLTCTACQPLYGRLTDIFGRKVILLGSLFLFLIGSVISGVSRGMTMLIIARAVAGIGGGGIVTVVSIVVSDVVSLQDRGKYQGIIGIVVAAGTALGPLIGGLFTEKISWRWCFYISVPLSGVAMVVVAFALPLRKVEGHALEKIKQIDGWGCLISFSASIAILLPISWAGTQYSWTSAAVIAPLLLGVALIGVFLFVEFKVARLPLIPLHMFKNSHVSICILTSFLTGFMTFVNLYYLPQFYQVARGDSALRSGILILPLILSQIVTSFTSGFLVSKYSCYRINLIVGYALWTIASGLFTMVTPSTSAAVLVVFQLLTGLGSGQTLQTTLVAIQAAVKREEMAVITGARNYLRMMGSTLAVAASAAIVNNIVRTKLEAINFPRSIISEIIADPTKIASMSLSAAQKTDALNAYAHGVQVTYYMMTALAGIQFFLCVFFVKDYTLKRDDDQQKKEAARAWLMQKKNKRAGGNHNAEPSPAEARQHVEDKV